MAHVRMSSIKTIHIELLNWDIARSEKPERKINGVDSNKKSDSKNKLQVLCKRRIQKPWKDKRQRSNILERTKNVY